MRGGALAFLALAGVGLAVYGEVIPAPFHFDDHHSVEYNPHIRSLTSVPRFFVDPATFSSHSRGFMYRPVLLSTYAIDHAAWGGAPAGFRAVNLGLHVLASWLFGRLALRLGAAAGAGLGASLLFLVHPVHTEVVAYISSRSDLLVAALYLACLLALEGGRPAAGLLAYGAALLTKEVAATLPLLAGLHDLARGGWRRVAARRGRYLALAAVTCAYLAVLWGTRFLASSYGKLPRSPLTEILTQVKALVLYGWLAASPVHLNVDHAFRASPTPWEAVVLAAAALVVSALALAARHPRAAVSCGAWLFAVAMLPYCVVPLNIMVAERRTYLATCGLLLVGLWGWRQARRRWGQRLRPIGIALCAVLALLAFDRNRAWAGEVALWRDAVAKNPTGARAHLNLALAYKRAGEPDSAMAPLREGLRLDPGFAEGWVALGELRFDAGDESGALAALRRGAALDPTLAGVHHNLGNAFMPPGAIDVDSALVHYRRALELDPQFAEARNNLGQALERQGLLAQACEQYRRAVADSLDWYHTDDPVGGAWFNLGHCAEQLGDAAEARHAFARARDLLGADPRYAEYVRRAEERLRAQAAAGAEAP